MSRAWSFLGLLSAAVAQVGCSSPTDNTRQLTVSLALGADTVRYAQAVTVRIATVNVDRVPITVSSKGCPYPFSVTDDGGTVVGPEGLMCTADAVVRELAPGDSLVLQYNWVPRGIAMWPSAPLLAPGAYHVRAQIGALGGLVRSRPASLHIVQ